MEDCIKKIGLDIKLIEQELARYENDTTTQVDYLINLEAIAWNVADDMENVLISMEKHIEKHQGENNFNKPIREKKINLKAFNFINKKINKIKDDYSSIVLFCVRDQMVGKSFIEADKIFEHWMNEIGEIIQYLAFEIESRNKLIPQRLERNLKKLYWMGSEEILIDMFEQFKSKEFWEYDGDTKNAIALHFSIDNRDVIPIKSDLPFQKLNWLFQMNDLVKWYKVMIEKNYIDVPHNLHLVLASHFFIDGGNIDYKLFGDRFQHVKPKGDYKTRYPLNQYLDNLPKLSI